MLSLLDEGFIGSKMHWYSVLSPVMPPTNMECRAQEQQVQQHIAGNACNGSVGIGYKTFHVVKNALI